ncbi:sporulation protein SsgA [Erythrobacter arachoides]|uniref:Sporulation protein SsgA n=1 Tax=Aurantiacibacter arachoides TaxID=1850444 RepID=A0A845A236_9SPHN|nr:SPOR domain-containing protein [Aurantiacibacter arachoides]MXO93206.1 sporulation protein SsgA [Aurantiacibacter arachoides]GGD51188.1 endolytic peptidoglycan transglycosylase RlpA [Aurantiacibacter arachoides]
MIGLGSTETSIAGLSANQPDTGPSADYPVVIGGPYTIDGIEYVPTDTMNVDEVGYAALDASALGVTAAHHTLPLPSYAEVTSLESGLTILVRVERRGPMASNDLIALAPAALEQLGAAAGDPVRVRRVNPPEDQRTLLRSGAAALPRMDTPGSLLTILQRRLPMRGAASLAANRALVPQAGDVEPVAIAASDVVPPAAAEQAEPAEIAVAPWPGDAPEVTTTEAIEAGQRAAEVANTAPAPAVEGGFIVQAAAFASEENASRAAAALGGTISRSGRFYRVRTGPFATRGEAEASLANVRRAGYSDARILTSG